MYLVPYCLNDCRDHFRQTRAASSVKTWESHARVIGSQWPDLPLADLTRHMVQTWLAGQAKTVAPSTGNHRLFFLRSACELAVESSRIETNPCVGVKNLRVDNKIHRDITPEEEARLELHMPRATEWSIIRFAILTGVRRAEQFRLQVQHVDFQRRGLKVQGSKGTRLRWVPLGAEALEIARLWASAVTTLDPGAKPDRGLLSVVRPPGEWLFLPLEQGCRIAVGARFCRLFRLAVQDSGLPRTRWHDLRHAFASRIVQQPGASLYHVQTLLGHQDPKTTMRYAHLQDQHLRRFTDGLR